MALFSRKPKSWLFLLSLVLSYVAICSADVRDHWSWTDRVSCRPRLNELTEAWDEFAALADESAYVLSRTLSRDDRDMLNSMYNPTSREVEDIRSRLRFLLSVRKNTGAHKVNSCRTP